MNLIATIISTTTAAGWALMLIIPILALIAGAVILARHLMSLHGHAQTKIADKCRTVHSLHTRIPRVNAGSHLFPTG